MPESITPGGMRAGLESGVFTGVGAGHPPLSQFSSPPELRSSLSGSLGSPGEEKSQSCIHETQQVPSVPRIVFVRPIVGRLEDLTSTCISTFHHTADTFVLNNDEVSSPALPLVEPPVGN